MLRILGESHDYARRPLQNVSIYKTRLQGCREVTHDRCLHHLAAPPSGHVYVCLCIFSVLGPESWA
jgi:hypothetical protein